MAEKESSAAFTKQEAELIGNFAKQQGISFEEATTLAFKSELAHRIKKRTGKSPARVYTFKGRK